MNAGRDFKRQAVGATGAAAALALGFAGVGAAAPAGSKSPATGPWGGAILSVEQLVKRSEALDGKEVLVRGDLVVETHGNYVWARAGRLAGQGGACAQYELNDEIYNRRERLSRTHAVLRGRVVHLGSRQRDRDECTSVGLANVTVVRYRPISRSMEDVSRRAESIVIDPASEEGAALYAFGERLRRAVASGATSAEARPAVAELIAPDRREIVRSRLAVRDSRPNAVLFDDVNSFGSVATRRPRSLVVVRTGGGGPGTLTSICVCGARRCDWKHVDGRDIYHRPAGRSEVCLPMDDSKRWLEARYLLGRPDGDRLGRAPD